MCKIRLAGRSMRVASRSWTIKRGERLPFSSEQYISFFFSGKMRCSTSSRREHVTDRPVWPSGTTLPHGRIRCTGRVLSEESRRKREEFHSPRSRLDRRAPTKQELPSLRRMPDFFLPSSLLFRRHLPSASRMEIEPLELTHAGA